VKVKLLTSRAGNNFAQSMGDVIDVPAAEGKRMIDAGQAQAVRKPAKRPAETATAAPAENAAADPTKG